MIQVKPFTFNPFQENTYVVSNDQKSCFIIDPGCLGKRENEQLSRYIESEGLTPTALLNTHCHIDHILGNRYVSEEYGLTPRIHPAEKTVLDAAPSSALMFGIDYSPSPDPDYLPESSIALDDEIFEILFVPGHSPGHVAFYHAASGTLLSGDVLFRQSIGRTDLPGGDMQTLLQSIREKLFVLPDATKVFAGHMEPTTIGFEKAHNPFLS